jgi:FAD-dependent oxidoreductase family protein
MKFRKNYDVIVGGAGIAGIAAALESARSGMKTALVEKTVLPGGLATAGMVNIYLPLCDGNGNQIIFGIAEELLKLSVEYSPASLPKGWGGVEDIKHNCINNRNIKSENHAQNAQKDIPNNNALVHKQSRYLTRFSPASFILSLDKVLEEAGVEIWYDTLICSAAMEENKITGIEVENKSGRGLLSAKCVIDATGDADIAAMAGVELETGLNNLSIWALQAAMKKAEGAVKYKDSEMLLDMIRLGADDSGKGHPEGAKKWNGINGKYVSEFILLSRKLLRNHYEAQEDQELENRPFPLALPAMAQFRMTRKIVGRETVLNKNENIDIPNAVAAVPDWRSAGRVWQIPYGALIPAHIEGLVTAGRIISVEDGDAWNVCRVIPAAALTGQLAGKAATISVSEKISTQDISPKEFLT